MRGPRLVSTFAIWFAAGLLAALPSVAAENTESAIAPGTAITHRNWQNFKRYMPDSMQTLWRGDMFWHLSPDPSIVVGPSQSIPLPNFFKAATQPGTAGLKQRPEGGYVTENYRGGVPYPNPLSGDSAMTGQRIYWNMYYRYHPRAEGALCAFRTLDRYGDKSRIDAVGVYSQLAFNSDPGFAGDQSSPYYYNNLTQQIAPEAGKYTRTLILQPADSTAEWELYAFIPSLRRSLRLPSRHAVRLFSAPI